MPTEAINPARFVEELESMRNETLQVARSGQLGRLDFGDSSLPPRDRPQVAGILKLLMYPERRVGDVLAKRVGSISDLDIKERVASQMLEEISHVRLLRKMLADWGHDPDSGWTEPIRELVWIFDYIESLETLSEFFSTFLIGEGLFLSTYLDDMYETDPKAFSPYLEAARADEPGHIKLAADAVERYAVTAELQQKTRLSARKLLDMFLGGYQARVREMRAQMMSSESSGARRTQNQARRAG